MQGFHGTILDLVPKILGEGFRQSGKQGMWLGAGSYFFQDGPEHARSWAERVARSTSGEPCVIKATISLIGFVDLLDRGHWNQLRRISDLVQNTDNEFDQMGPQSEYEHLTDEQKFGLYHHDIDHKICDLYVGLIEKSRCGEKVAGIRSSFSSGLQLHPASWIKKRNCVMLNVRRPEAILHIEIMS